MNPKRICRCLVLPFIVVLGCGGDGNSNNNNNNNSFLVDFGGPVLLDPISEAFFAGGSQPDLSGLLIEVVDPQDFVLDPVGYVPLAETTVQCDTSGCTWFAPQVDISQLSLGLITLTSDPSMPAQFVVTNTGIIDAQTVRELRMTLEPQMDSQVLVTSVEAGEAVGALTATDSTEPVDWATMSTNGFLFLQATEDAPNPDDDPVPLGGVTAEATNPGYSKAYYIADGFASLGSAAETTGVLTGTFIMTARTPNVLLGDVNIFMGSTQIHFATVGTAPGTSFTARLNTSTTP